MTTEYRCPLCNTGKGYVKVCPDCRDRPGYVQPNIVGTVNPDKEEETDD